MHEKSPFSLPEVFPDPRIRDAYLHPTVQVSSTDKFKWQTPELFALREYAMKRFSWSQSKADEHLLPVFKKMNQAVTSQSSLLSYFSQEKLTTRRKIKSKRLQNAVLGMLELDENILKEFEKDIDEDDDDDGSNNTTTTTTTTTTTSTTSGKSRKTSQPKTKTKAKTKTKTETKSKAKSTPKSKIKPKKRGKKTTSSSSSSSNEEEEEILSDE